MNEEVLSGIVVDVELREVKKASLGQALQGRHNLAARYRN
jgi:hypothetical protein